MYLYMLRITASLDNLETVREYVKGCATTLGASQEDIFGLMLAADEAVTNIIQHGYCGKMGFIEIESEQTGPELLIHIRDEAPRFDPTGIPEPDLTLPLEKRPLGGLGMHLIRKYMDQVAYQYTTDGRNHLMLRKKFVTGGKI
jgi:serine/threonine-protein kinase RsbW